MTSHHPPIGQRHASGLSALTKRARMTLADRLKDTPQRIHGKPCSVGALEDYLAAHDANEHHAFLAMLHELGWSGQRIYSAVQREATALRDKGETEKAAAYGAMAEQTVNRHRSRTCRCYKAVA